MQSQRFDIINHVTFISGHTKDILKNHCGSVCNEQMFQELESYCRKYVDSRVKEYLEKVSDSQLKAYSAENVVYSIKLHYDYSLQKNSPKMRFTKKELDSRMDRLNEVEKDKVIQWLNDNGGYDKYIFQQWGNAE